jgi:hypothetical protein
VQASDMARLLAHLRETSGGTITAADVRRGERIARRDATMRRTLYAVLPLLARRIGGADYEPVR